MHMNNRTLQAGLQTNNQTKRSRALFFLFRLFVFLNKNGSCACNYIGTSGELASTATLSLSMQQGEFRNVGSKEEKHLS